MIQRFPLGRWFPYDGLPDHAGRYTIEEVLAFPKDGNRYELVHGTLLVSPTPGYWHRVIVTRLCAAPVTSLEAFRDVAEAVVSPADITWGTDDDLAQPDVFVAPTSETSNGWIRSEDFSFPSKCRRPARRVTTA